MPTLSASLEGWRAEHARAVAGGVGRLRVPKALVRKYPSLETDWAWQRIFPATRDCFNREAGRYCRHRAVRAIMLA